MKSRIRGAPKVGVEEPGAIYQFGRFALDLNRGVLTSGGAIVCQVRPKTLALLQFFVENPGRVLSHEAIAGAVWPGLIVTDESIAQCVHDVRRVVGGNARFPIRTVPRRGYLFADQVNLVPAADVIALPQNTGNVQHVASSAAPGGVVQGRKTAMSHRPLVALVAIGGLRDHSDCPISIGIADELTTELAMSTFINVTAPLFPLWRRPNDGDLMSVARGASAQYLLEVCTRSSDTLTRVAARLIDLATSRYVWAKRYDRTPHVLIPCDDALPAVVARGAEYAVMAAEQRKALQTEFEQLDPGGLYQFGMWHLASSTSSGNDRASQAFSRAISFDPSFAAAHSALAFVRFNEGGVYGSRQIEDAMALAQSSIRIALQIDPDDEDAQATAGMVSLGMGHIDHAWQDVGSAFRAPDLPWALGVQGSTEHYAGRRAKGRSLLSRSIAAAPRDPRAAVLMTQIAVSYYLEGDYRRAVEQAVRVLSRYPDYPTPWKWLAAAYGQLGLIDHGKQALSQAAHKTPQGLRRDAHGGPPWMRPGDHEHTLDGLNKVSWRRADWI